MANQECGLNYCGYKPRSESTNPFCVHVCVGVACIYLDDWRGARQTTCRCRLELQMYPCIYDVRNCESKVALVKENARKAIADTLQGTGEMILLVLACFLHILWWCV